MLLSDANWRVKHLFDENEIFLDSKAVLDLPLGNLSMNRSEPLWTCCTFVEDQYIYEKFLGSFPSSVLRVIFSNLKTRRSRVNVGMTHMHESCLLTLAAETLSFGHLHSEIFHSNK